MVRLFDRRAQAARWLARLQADDVSDKDRAACRAWLGRNPANRLALAQITQAWDVAGGLALSEDIRRPADFQPMARRTALAGAAALGAGALWMAAAPASYATGRGEIRTVRLRDGSRVVLDTSSRITVALTRKSRRLDMVTGRAMITVASDIEQPFLVANGPQRILAPVGSLEVSRRDDDVSTLSLDGPVFVKQGSAGAMRLERGERLAQGASRPALAPPSALEAASAWQRGRLIFEDEPLGVAVREVNRYGARPLVLASPEVGRLRISGAYSASDTDQFAHAVATLFGLRVSEGRQGVLLSPA